MLHQGRFHWSKCVVFPTSIRQNLNTYYVYLVWFSLGFQFLKSWVYCIKLNYSDLKVINIITFCTNGNKLKSFDLTISYFTEVKKCFLISFYQFLVLSLRELHCIRLWTPDKSPITRISLETQQRQGRRAWNPSGTSLITKRSRTDKGRGWIRAYDDDDDLRTIKRGPNTSLYG